MTLALVPFVALCLLLASCADANPDDAATAQETAISHDDVAQIARVLRSVGSLQQSACGQVEGEGDTIEAACDRVSLGLLLQFALAEAYAAEHDVTVTDADLQEAADAFDQNLGRSVLEDALAANGATYDDFTAVLRRSLLQREVSRALVIDDVGEDGLREQYDATPTDQAIVQADHILVETEEEARDIYEQVTAPGFTRDDFLELAGRVSIDPSAAENSGSLASTPASQLVPEFAGAAVALEPGEISEPVQTEFGWHVIRLEDKQVTPYAEARERLLEDRAGVTFAGWMRERVGEIEVNPRYGRLDTQTLQVVRITSTDPSSAPPSSGAVNVAPEG